MKSRLVAARSGRPGTIAQRRNARAVLISEYFRAQLLPASPRRLLTDNLGVTKRLHEQRSRFPHRSADATRRGTRADRQLVRARDLRRARRSAVDVRQHGGGFTRAVAASSLAGERPGVRAYAARLGPAADLVQASSVCRIAVAAASRRRQRAGADFHTRRRQASLRSLSSHRAP